MEMTTKNVMPLPAGTHLLAADRLESTYPPMIMAIYLGDQDDLHDSSLTVMNGHGQWRTFKPYFARICTGPLAISGDGVRMCLSCGYVFVWTVDNPDHASAFYQQY